MSIDTDYSTLRTVLAGMRSGLWPGVAQTTGRWAAEFGVYSGYSLGIIAKHMPVIGFDSFEGLPEDWRPGFPKGSFYVGDSEDERQEIMRRITPMGYAMLVPGWFSDTVPTFPFPPLGLVHVDCDLYSSTVTVLEAVLPYLDDGSIIVFDEFEGVDFDDEKRAFEEWMDRHSVSAGLIAAAGEEAAFAVEFPQGRSW